MIYYYLNIYKKKNFDCLKYRNKQQMIFLIQKTESSYSGFFIRLIILCTCFQNHFGFSDTSFVKSNRLRCCQMLFSCNVISSFKIFFVLKPRYLIRRIWCLLQNLKFFTKNKATSEIILSIKYLLIFLDKRTICYSTFSLTF